MKNNKKGFTLVELLAVIVILAIVMGIAATLVIPMIEDARKGAFASTAMTIVDAASKKASSDIISGTNKTCYTVKELVTGRYIDKIEAYDSTANPITGQYEGIVEYDAVAKRWNIHIIDHTNNYVIGLDSTKAYGKITANDVANKTDTSNVGTCVNGIYSS